MNKHANMTNAEFVNNLMEGYNPYGVLSQMVIIDALGKGLKLISEHKDELLAENERIKEEGKTTLICYESWVKCNEYILEKFNEKYNRS